MGILVLTSYIKSYLPKDTGEIKSPIGTEKKKNFSSILAPAFVRNILLFLANVAPDSYALSLFHCQVGLNILETLSKKSPDNWKANSRKVVSHHFFPGI